MVKKRFSFIIEFFLVVLIVMGLFPAASAEILHVGPNNCPYRSVQDAVDHASSGDEIWVVQGTYHENLLIMDKSNLSIIGGYADETFSRRDPTAYSTTINGSQQSHVIKVYNATGITIDGFVITNGKALNGGGICANTYSGSSIDLTLKNNIIKGNSAENVGGGVSCYSSLDGGPISIVMINNTITANSTPQIPSKGGGGAYLKATSSNITASILNNTFSGNKSNAGGGISISSSSGYSINVDFLNNHIYGNDVSDNGGGMAITSFDVNSNTVVFIEGNTISENTAYTAGGIWSRSMDLGSVSLSLFNNAFTDNTVSSGGGGINLNTWGGAATLTIMENLFDGNIAGGGAGIIAASHSGGTLDLDLSRNTFRDNISNGSGGAMSVSAYDSNSKADLNLSNNLIYGGSAVYSGGGIWLYTSNGGTLSADLCHSTVTNNTAGWGGGLCADTEAGHTTAICRNSILWGNSITDTAKNASKTSVKLDLYHCCLGSSLGGYNDKGGNLNINPIFLAPSMGNYHLSPTSLLIDNGQFIESANYDIDGDLRPRGWGRYDIGTDEADPIYHFAGGDFDGDGKTDIAVWRPLNGKWFIKDIAIQTWGALGDIPVPGDYNGDGITELAVWRSSNGKWFIKGTAIQTWGALGDIPVPGDYNGDGITELAVWRPSNGKWFIKGAAIQTWGALGDIPVPGDFNGDGITELAVWRPSNGKWFIKGAAIQTWGALGDIPVPGDFNGDGITELAVWRPSKGKWFVKGIAELIWGMLGDIPVPGDYDGDGVTDIAVWRPSKGKWFIKDVALHLWGSLGDIPISR
jgi:hypothetical protein